MTFADRLTLRGSDVTVREATPEELAYQVPEKRYSPDQPRVPAGEAGGGEFAGSGGATLADGHSAPLLESLDQARRELLPLDRERAVVLNTAGHRVFQAEGTAGRVEVNAVELAPKLGPGTIFVHNHPESNSSFSSGDLAVAAYMEAAETRLETKNWTYVARPGEQGWPQFVRLAEAVERFSDTYAIAHATEIAQVNAQGGKYSPANLAFNEKAWHEINSKVAASLNFTYFREARK